MNLEFDRATGSSSPPRPRRTYAVVSTFLIVKVVDLILGIRVSPRDEEIGIDLATHGEVAYQT